MPLHKLFILIERPKKLTAFLLYLFIVLILEIQAVYTFLFFCHSHLRVL
jgi:hypothetical protein